MKPVKKINKESLLQALKNGSDATEQAASAFNKLDGAWKNVVGNKDDPRDLYDLAFFLKYERKINGTGEVLSDEEFETECKDLITAFANNDREKIYGYLDRWFNFALNYTPAEDIESVDDATVHFIYLRAKQGLADTKLKNYPDYVKSRFGTIETAAKLQKVQVEINLQSEIGDVRYHENGFKISTDTYRIVTGNDEAEKRNLEIVCLAYAELKDEVEERFEFVSDLNEAFDLMNFNPQGEASVKPVKLPKWVTDIDLNNENQQQLEQTLGRFQTAVREAVGVDQTSAGIPHKYTNIGLDEGIFKFIFIDGECIYDKMAEPKNHLEGAKMLLSALKNKTGLVSFVHAVETTGGQFEYKVDTLDNSAEGENNPEYIKKLEDLKNSVDARKALFNKIDGNLTPFLVDQAKQYTKNSVEKLKENAKLTLDAKDKAIRKGQTYKAKSANGPDNASITIEKKNLGPAMYVMNEGRDIYRRYLHEFYAEHPDLKEKLDQPILEVGKDVKCDKRDLLDLFLFAKMSKTFGLADQNPNASSDKEIAYDLLTSFANRDHAGISKYLNYMFDFLKGYQIPEKIESTDDLIRAIMYIRVQQTSSMKQKENPWYTAEKYPTLLDKQQFEAFESEYYASYQKLEHAILQQTKVKVASSQEDIGRIYQAARDLESQEEAVRNGEEDEDYLIEMQGDQREQNYADLRESMTSQRRQRIENSFDLITRQTFKVTLPDSALICAGENVNPSALREAASEFYYHFFMWIYTTDYADGKVLRGNYFKNSDSQDAMHLAFIDGKSVYDIVTENGAQYDFLKAGEVLMKAMVDQTGLVQFAHILQDKDHKIQVELDTLDVSSPLYVENDYAKKLADYESNPEPMYNRITANINQVLNTNRIENEKNIEHQRTIHNLVREQLNDISRFSNGRFNIDALLSEFDSAFGKEKFDKKAYNELWKTVWTQAMNGLKDAAYVQDYNKEIPFAYVTNIVERGMKAALKVYGFEDKQVDRFGGMSVADMAEFLEKGVPTWEQKHLDMYFANTTPEKLARLPNLEFRFKIWEQTPIENYKNLVGNEAMDRYRDENGNLNNEGKRIATQSLIDFYDRINAFADSMTRRDLLGATPESMNSLRTRMHEFADKLRTAVIEMGVVNAEGFNKLSGKASPIKYDVDKFTEKMAKTIALEDKLDENRKERNNREYVDEEQAQWEAFAADDFDPFEANQENIDADNSLDDIEDGMNERDEIEISEDDDREQEIERNKQVSQEKRDNRKMAEVISSAETINFSSFMGGIYEKEKRDPRSAYALANMSEMRELEVFFGGMVPDDHRANFAQLAEAVPQKANKNGFTLSDEFAYNYGINIPQDRLNRIMDKILSQNINGKLEVDKTTFEKQYALLFKDLYTKTLHTLNKKCCAENSTIPAEKMIGAMEDLSKMMQAASKAVGYPEAIKNGGFTPKGIENLQKDFIDKFVPKTTQDLALRKMQACSKNFDFSTESWKSGLGYTAFNKLITQEKSLLGTDSSRTPEGQAKIAQLYRAMVMYNANRSGWSKFWNWRKNRAEKAAIQSFKDSAMKNTGLDVRAFDELLGNSLNLDAEKLESEVEKNYQKLQTSKEKSDILDAQSFRLGGTEESQTDLEDQQPNLNDSIVERISVPEANHRNEVKTKAKVEKEEQRERQINNDMNARK